MSASFKPNLLIKSPKNYLEKCSIKKLEHIVIVCKKAYYETDTPLISDDLYDLVEDTLRDKNPTSKVLTVDVVEDDEEINEERGAKVKLPFEMPSLNKAKQGTGIIDKWLLKHPSPYCVSDKIDGISLLYVKRGTKTSIYTRGRKGVIGHDVTRHLKHLDVFCVGEGDVKNVKNLVVRGELVITKDKESAFKCETNLRNIVSGCINHKTSNPLQLSHIRFVTYQVLEPCGLSQTDQFELLQMYGFYTVPYLKADKLNEKILLEIVNKTERNIQIDGLVIVENSASLDAIPVTTQTEATNPSWGIAFKTKGEEAETKVIRVEWSPSKRGLLKPVVIIEPVELSGCMINKATGHNADFILQNKISPGATVSIIRSGEVIPYIRSVNKEGKGPYLPTNVKYEWAGVDVKLLDSEISDSDTVTKASILHFVKTLNIEHLGPSNIDKLVASGLTNSYDILGLSKKKLVLLFKLESIKDLGKLWLKILDSIDLVVEKGIKLSSLMDASNTFEHGVGSKVMQKIVDTLGWKYILEEADSDPKFRDKLLKMKGIQEKTADKVIAGLKKFLLYFEELDPIVYESIENVESSQSDEAVEGNKFMGFRIVFTGIRDKEMMERLERMGATVATTVSKTHDKSKQIVICSDVNATSKKLTDAKALGCKIYTVDSFSLQL